MKPLRASQVLGVVANQIISSEIIFYLSQLSGGGRSQLHLGVLYKGFQSGLRKSQEISGGLCDEVEGHYADLKTESDESKDCKERESILGKLGSIKCTGSLYSSFTEAQKSKLIKITIRLGQKAQNDRIKKFALFRMSSFAQYGVLGSQTAPSSAANGREESDWTETASLCQLDAHTEFSNLSMSFSIIFIFFGLQKCYN